MRLNLDGAPPEALRDDGPQIGDVYKVEGGGRRGPRLQMIVAISGQTCYMLVFSAETGEVTGVNQYADYYLQRKYRVGRAELSDPVMTWGA